MMKPSILKKQIIREYNKNKKLTVFQKKQLTFLITSIRLDYETGLKFSEYIKENQADIEGFINDLDFESKNYPNLCHSYFYAFNG